MERRMIEQRLFQDEVLGVVATCALEVGVDIGGIDLTLHCGFPTSYESFIQQAGRARGKRLDVPSIAVMICFNSPAEQHIWRHPTRLLTQSLTTVPSMPFNFGIVQGHMLCASEEFPLMGSLPWTTLQQTVDIKSASSMMCDYELFGSTLMYEEALQMLVSAGSVVKETVAVASNESRTATVYKAHASARKPWTSVSLRSCEPVNYSVVDISHPGQGGRTDGIYDERAVMDHLPYSRVFYHAFPGAIITHRGRRYLVQSMTRPPPILPSISWGNGCNLAAYAKPTSARYITRPLSTLQTTSVKQMERLDLGHFAEKTAGLKTLCANVHDKLHSQSLSVEPLGLSFAGCGVLNVKRSVHGFKKLSMATLAEISRTEISMPPMEFDTFGVWIDTDACNLSRKLVDYGSGVHALSHALLAVSPLFVDCSLSDLDCEHSYFDPTRVVLFDNRPGGLGICAQLWKSLFAPKGLLDFAIELLEHCTTCSGDTSYNGGCPACLQSVKCLNFNHHLSKQAGLVVAKRMRQRLDESGLFTYDATSTSSALCTSPDRATTSFKRGTSNANTPRRKARAKALDIAKDIQTARDRSIVVGRPAWPLDDERGTDKQEKPE
jgi:DEAD/DEAH box helicase domain-containing protein